MAGCKINNQSVLDAREKIKGISDQYRSTGEAFISDLNNAIAEMEGAAKDAIKKFIDTDVNQFVATDLPDAVKGMSDLLEGNRDNFEKVDAQIAESISGG